MKFKEWHQLDEARFKGFMRKFKAQHPNVPEYVLKQMYQNHMSPGMTRAIDTASHMIPQGGPSDPNQSTIITPQNGGASPRLSPSLPSEIMSDRDLITGVQWTPKPVPVTVGPMDFADQTLRIFQQWKFGLNPNDRAVRNDTERFATQGKMAAERPDGSNEPVIMIREGDKFKLIEGFHRTMSYLLSAHDPSKGAPADQIQFIQQGGNVFDLDLSKWKPVKINAYVGVRQMNKPTMYSWPRPTPNNGSDVTASAAPASGPAATIDWPMPHSSAAA